MSHIHDVLRVLCISFECLMPTYLLSNSLFHHILSWYASFNILLGCFIVMICKEPPPRLTFTDFLQVPFIERTKMPLVRAERKIAELEPKDSNAELTID